MTPDFVELAHQNDSIKGFESAALAALQRSVGFDAAFFLVVGQEGHLTTCGLGSQAVENLVRRSRDYAAELAPVKRAALATRGVAVDTDVLGERRVRRSRYFREVAKSVSGRHGLLAYLRKGSQPFGLVMLGRSRGGFSAAEVANVETSLPILSLARLSFAVPWRSTPFESQAAEGFLSRMSGRVPVELASTPLGDGHVVVRDTKSWREMVAKTGSAELVWTRASLKNPSSSGWPYTDLFHLAAAQARTKRRALFIGCGGGVSIRQFAEAYPGIEIDVLEKEPVVAELATRCFGIAEIPQVRLHIADGADFVRHSPRATWDMVIVDAFDRKSFDQAFAKPAFLADTARVLTPGGALACNLIDVLTGGTDLPAIVTAAKKSFERVRLVPVVELDEAFSPFAPRNVVVVASTP
jgi:predicted O-methyltransferase YrrM